MTASPRVGIAFALCCLVILGAMPILANARPVGSDGLTFAVWMTIWQFLASLPLLALELAGRPRGLPAAPVRRGRLLAVAVLTAAMFAATTYMYIVAAEKAGAVSMAIALQAYPLFAMGLEWAWFGKRKSAAEIGWTLLMIVALVHLITAGTFKVSGISWWSAFALAIPLLWSIAHTLLRQVLVGMSVTPNQVTASRLFLSGLLLLALHTAIAEPGALSAAFADGGFQRAAVALGVAYYVELLLWFYAMRHIDVSLASSITVPAPALTMLISVVVLGEPVLPFQVLAMLVIAGALYGLLVAGRRRA